MLREISRSFCTIGKMLAYVLLMISAVLSQTKGEVNGKVLLDGDSISSNTTKREFSLVLGLTTPAAETQSTVDYVESITHIPLMPDAKNPEELWSPNVSPIFKVFKDFLFQERRGDLSTRNEAANTMNQTGADQILDMLNESFQEVMSTLKNEIEAVTFPTVQDAASPVPVSEKTEQTPLWDFMRINLAPVKRRQSTQNFANLTTSCSSCYSELSSCVQKCFIQHNCKSIERNARKCPPVPTRLCNPFTPWSPVDQCRVDADCESPLLCCDDGCVKRCSSGIWKH